MYPCCQGSNQHDSHCYYTGPPILLHRVRRQSCASWRQHYGIVQFDPELSGKRLELLKELSQALSRCGPRDLDQPATHSAIKEMEASRTSAQGAASIPRRLRFQAILRRLFAAATRDGLKRSLMLVSRSVVVSHRSTVVGLAAKSRLPACISNPALWKPEGLCPTA